MNIEQLRYVAEIAKCGSMAAAARKLHISQSGISQAVSQLEKELGIRIFYRSRSGASLTPEGAKIAEKAADIVGKVGELAEIAELNRGWIRQKLRVAVAPGLISMLVNTILEFRERYPSVSLEINEMTSAEVIKCLHENEIDLGLIPENEVPELAPDYRFNPVLESKIVVIVNSKSPLARKKLASPEDLKPFLFINYDEPFVDRFLEKYVARHGRLNLLFRTKNQVALAFALQSPSVFTIGFDYPFRLLDSQEIAAVDIGGMQDVVARFGWICASGGPLSGVAEHFMNLFAEACRK